MSHAKYVRASATAILTSRTSCHTAMTVGSTSKGSLGFARSLQTEEAGFGNENERNS